MENQQNRTTIIVFALIAVLLCCTCLLASGGALLFLMVGTESVVETLPTPWTMADPVPVLPMPAPSDPRPTPDFSPTITGTIESTNAALETLQTMENTIVPINDPIELAQRLEGKQNLPRSLEFPVQTYAVGDERSFWVTNSDNNENTLTKATLRYVTDHVYFWVENGVRVNERQMKALVDTYEEEIYPTNRDFFGSEWTPGVDADPHMYILYTRGLGGSVAGYFSSADEYLPEVHEYSNGAEMFLLSADHVELDEEFAYSVLAHEFQHMIHWFRDRNEETWMNEGASDLAAFLNGYDIGGHDMMFVIDPDIQLSDWPTTPDDRTAHYGAAFMFMTYFLDRFGDAATQALVADPANGMSSIDEVLAQLQIRDPLTGQQIRADDVFADWVIANFLQDEQVGDGRYTYHNYPGAPDVSATESIEDCPSGPHQRDVSQYGADYLSLECRRGDYLLRFEGLPSVGVLPAGAYSGDYAFYSNRGDESNMMLTRQFDFSSHSGPLTLSYWTWYDLEEDYDYAYVSVSEDGENWEILTTPSGTAEDPSGNSYGWGYNAFSGGGPQWIQEQLDLSRFAGKQVQVRFEYITDAAVNGEGLLLDDIAIPEIGFATDFEQDDGGWQADGFVRIQNVLPQTFSLALIRLGDVTTVERIALPEGNVIEIPISFDGDIEQIVLVVSGNARHTRQRAPYQVTLVGR